MIPPRFCQVFRNPLIQAGLQRFEKNKKSIDKGYFLGYNVYIK